MSPHERFARTRHFGSLDGLRALAVSAVVWHHAGARITGVAASARGFLGVDLFFVISGFLITTLLLRERADHGRIDLPRFLARRALRIFPLWYALLAALTIILLFVTPDAPMRGPFLGDLPYNATYTSNFIDGSTFLALSWSLAMEEQFYLVWPLVLACFPRHAWCFAVLVIGVGLEIWSGLLDGALEAVLGAGFHALDMLDASFNPIALGVLAGWGLHQPRGRAPLARVLGARAAAPCIALACAALVNWLPPASWSTMHLGPTGDWGYARGIVQLGFALLVVACVLREDHGLAPLLRLRPLAWIGSVSYGVYLLHMLGLQLARELWAALGIAGPGDLVSSFVAALLLAALSKRFIERPFLRRKARFRPRTPSGPTVDKTADPDG